MLCEMDDLPREHDGHGGHLDGLVCWMNGVACKLTGDPVLLAGEAGKIPVLTWLLKERDCMLNG